MKNTIKLILISFLMFPIMIFASSNYSDAIDISKEYISKFNDYKNYIVTDDFPYDYNGNKIIHKTNFKKSGFLSKNEYDITVINNASYLSPGIEYWTLTESAGDLVYVINIIAEEKSVYSYSGVRITQFVKDDVSVVGSGTYVNPWVFMKLYGITFKSTDSSKGLVSLTPCSENNGKNIITFSLDPSIGKNFYICPQNGYKYFSSTCSTYITNNSGVDNQYRVSGIVNDGQVCQLSFTYDTRKINLNKCDGCTTEVSPTTFYYSDVVRNWYVDSNAQNRIEKLITLPKKIGYSFKGYVISQGSNDYVIDSNGEFIDRDISGINNLYPVFEANQYKVSLKSDNATKLGTTEITATYNSDLSNIIIPERTYTVTLDANGSGTTSQQIVSKYNFDGFYKDDEQYYTSSGESARTWDVANDTTLNVKWSGGTITLPTLTWKGHTFLGWFSEPSGGTKISDGNKSYLPTKNMKLYAQWSVNTYSVSLNANNATSTNHTKNVTVTYGNDMLSITKPTRVYTVTYDLDGVTYSLTNSNTKATYSFKGYYLDSVQYYNANGTSAKKWDKTSGASLTAQWDTGCVTLPNLSKSGFTFNGWYTSSTTGSKVGSGGAEYCPTNNIDLYARWSANSYNVSLDDGSGKVIGTLNVVFDQKLSDVTVPTKKYNVTYNSNYSGGSNSTATSNYKFKGFYYNSIQYISATGVGIKNWNIASNTTLVANWDCGTLTLPALSRTGYIFDGWYTSASGGTKIGNGGANYCPESSTTLYAKWVANKYNVSLDDGSGNIVGTVVATYGSSLPTINNIISRKYTISYNANGGNSVSSSTSTYSFSGYYLNGTQYYKSDGTSARTWNVPENTTLKASWSAGVVTLPVSTRPGYIFKGWYTAASGGSLIGTAGASYTPSSNITLYAHWQGNQYSLSFNSNGASSAGTTSATAVYGSNMPTITKPVKKFTVTFNDNGGSVNSTSATSTYTFNGYYYNSKQYYNNAGESANKWDVLGGATLTADWSGGGITLPEGSRNGYALEGWYTSSSGGSRLGGPGDKYYPTSSSTIYAQWTKTTNVVTLNQNGGSGGTSSVVATSSQAMPSITKPTKKFTVTLNYNGNGTSTSSQDVTYSFGGYYLDSVQYYTSAGSSARNWDKTSDLTLLAKWTGGTLTLPSPTYDGYTFSGWYTEKDYGGTKVGNGGASYSPTSNITLYARWTANTYTVNYDCKGDSNNMSSSTHVYGVASALNTSTCTKKGNKFVSWNTKADGTGTPYSNGASVSTLTKSANGSVTLYAQWSPITYKIKFAAGGGSGSMSDISIKYGEEKNLTANAFTKSGYAFNVWSGSDGKTYTNGQKVSNLTEVDGSTITLTANWKSGSYKLTFNAVPDHYAGTTNTDSSFDGSFFGQAGETANGYGSKTVTNMPNPNPMTGSTLTIPGTAPTAVSTKAAQLLTWTFAGWTTQDAITGASDAGLKVVTAEYQPGDQITITKDTTLYAVWYWTYGMGGLFG